MRFRIFKRRTDTERVTRWRVDLTTNFNPDATESFKQYVCNWILWDDVLGGYTEHGTCAAYYVSEAESGALQMARYHSNRTEKIESLATFREVRF